MAITDRESATAWLRGKSRDVQAAIAARSALRAIPGIADSRMDKGMRNKVALSVMRVVITSVAASKGSDRLREIAQYVSLRDAIAASNAALTAPGPYVSVANAANSARSAAESAGSRTGYVVSEATANSAHFCARIGDYRAVFSALDWDAEALVPSDGHPLRTSEVFNRSLWPEELHGDILPGEPLRFAKGYTRLLAFFGDDPAWDFWKRWLEGMRTGNPLPWELQEQVALIGKDDDFKIWEDGPEAVAREIEDIEKAWRSQAAGDVDPEPVSPADVSSLFQRAPIVQASMSSMSEAITLRLDAFSNMVRPNEKIAFVETLRGIPETAQRISAVLEEGPDAENAETTLALEVGRLRAEVAQLRADLKAAQASIAELRKKPWYKSSSVFVAGGAAMLSAIVAGVWTLLGDDKTLEVRWNKLAGDLAFLSSQVWPETEDRVFDELKFELPNIEDL